MGYYTAGDGATGTWSPRNNQSFPVINNGPMNFGDGGGGGGWSDPSGGPGFDEGWDAALMGRRHRRHMNSLNPHALRRAMRRVQSFAKFAKKTISFTHHVKMKKHRRK